MNKEFKQWKKILAHPGLLVGQSFVLFLLSIAAFSWLNNCILMIERFLSEEFRALKAKDFESIGATGHAIDWNFLLSKEAFLPRIEYPIQKWLWFFFFFFVIYVIAKAAYKQRIAFRDILKGNEGTQRWTTLEEVKKQYKAVPMDDTVYPGHSGIPVLCHDNILYVDDSNTNAQILGATQSGKTQLQTYPTLDLIMRAEIKDSPIIIDLKGDMLRNTKAEFIKYGFDVHCLNLIDPDNGVGFNPLELVKQAYIIRDFGKAQMLANTFSYSIYFDPNAKDKIWQDASIALLNALILAVCDMCIANNQLEKITIYTITLMLTELGSNPDENDRTQLDDFFDGLDAASPAKLQYATIETSKGVTRSGIYMNALAKLKNYTYDKIAKLTARSTFNLEDLAYAEKPIALFIVYPDWDDSNNTLIATLLSQTNAVLAEKATLSRTSKLPRRVVNVFEEVANIPAIEGLSRGMNVGLQRGILYRLYLQSNDQLDDKYGEKLAGAIRGACGNTVFIMSDELKDAEDFSEKLGKQSIIKSDRHGDPMSRDKSYGEREDGRLLLDKNELRNLKEGEWAIDRTKKRKDLKLNHITSYPIFATHDNKTAMQLAWQYLGHRFKSDQTLTEMDLGDGHGNIDLDSLRIRFRAVEAEGEVTSQEEENIAYKEISEPTKQVEKEVEFVADNVEEINATSTYISEVLTADQHRFVKIKVKNFVTPEEYDYFNTLETMEEITSFLNSKERLPLAVAVNRFIRNIEVANE